MSYALITGASKGIGKEIAHQLAMNGYDVLLVARNSYELQMVKEELEKKYPVQVDYLVSDLSEQGAVDRIVDWVETKQIDLRILVNNAGFGLVGKFDSYSFEENQKMMQVNVLAPVLLAQLLYRQQKSRAADSSPNCDIPAVIQLLDQKLITLNPDYFSYTLSKGALECASQMMAMDFAPYLRVVGLAPGISLPSGPQSEDSFKAAHTMTPLKRSSTPIDIAKTAVFIAESNAITGTTIYVDGGQHLMPSSRDVMFKTK